MVISQKKAVKKKFMAATSMLLIACIMLISASYAWFTLSTAPEVKGITTTVGANGNLEIALATDATWEDDGESIASNVGSSSEATKDVTLSNITWGNIVDLSAEAYGLSQISLLPSELNVTDGTVLASPLKTPSYGADGRVIDTTPNTSYAKYDRINNKFPVLDADPASDTYATAGRVQAIGSALALTDRQLAYRNAKSQVTASKKSAQTSAADSIVVHGATLADIIVRHASENDTYTVSDVDALAGVVSYLDTAVGYISDSLDAAVLGFLASAKGEGTADNGIDATEFEIIENYFADAAEAGTTPYTISADGTISITIDEETYSAATGSTDLGTIGTSVTSMKAAVLAAETAVGNKEAATGLYAQLTSTDGITWGEISGAMSSLIDANEVTVCGLPTDGLLDDLDAFVKAYSKNGLIVAMPTGSGLYADIADFCGDYSAGIVIPEISYGTLGLTEVEATMRADTTLPADYLSVLATAVTAAGSPSSDSTEAANLTDFYGYAIDLFFRTNADSSNLLLQTAPAQRIYTDSEEESTQGGGSSMTFKSTVASFDTTEVTRLMGAIRVVFMNSAGEIYAYARLETEKAVVGSDSDVTADLRLCDATGKLLGTYDGDTLTAYDSTITALTANKPEALTALVYLDGNLVDNSMVANATNSMTGTLNLQFASDVELVPMENTALYGEPTEEEQGEQGEQEEIPTGAAIPTFEIANIETTRENA